MSYVVCPTCEGEGSIVNPEVDGNGFTGSELDELGPEFVEDYFAGVYDVACPQCKGLRVVKEDTIEKYNEEHDEQRRDHFERLRESGIFPGSRDYF